MRTHPTLAAALLGLLAVALAPVSAGAQAPTLPGVDFKGLAQEEVTALTTLLGEGACPCDPQKTLLQCIGEKSCDKATDLAAYGADKFRDGFGIEEVRAAVVKKYMDDNITFTFELKDTPRKGPENAAVVIVEFADFECPHCRLMSGVLDQVAKKYPRQVAVYFKQFPLPSHIMAEKASRATLAAMQQGRFWEMHDMVFANQMTLSDEKFIRFAQELGLNIEKFKAAMASDAVRRQVARDKEEGIQSQIGGTPTIFVNGKLYHGDKTLEAISKHIDGLLKKQKK
jgi:protein-disulfide isomerase